METSQLKPDDCQGRTVNLPEGMFTEKKHPESENLCFVRKKPHFWKSKYVSCVVTPKK